MKLKEGIMDKWTSVVRPGYLGGKRDKKHAEWNAMYGEKNWRLIHIFDEVELDFLGVCAVYEDAYFYFLEKNPKILNQLISEASNVWDDAESNMQCGFDYLKQETNRTHIQDIAIRRSIARMGLCFKGKKPIRIRDKDDPHPLSMILSPGQVPFHRPEKIVEPEMEGWWKPGSVESFYQSNKIFQVKT
jgi:hypothetical protein